MLRFRNILYVATSGAQRSHSLERAVALAQSHDARLTVLDGVECISSNALAAEAGLPIFELQEAIIEEHCRHLEALIEPWRDKIDIRPVVRVGAPFIEIIREVLRGEHDLVVKSAEDDGLIGRIFGSADMHLLRKCPCPVLLVKPDASPGFKRIMAAVDVDDGYPPGEMAARQELNRRILEYAGSLAVEEEAELHIAHVWDALCESAMRGAFATLPEDRVADYVERVRERHSENLTVLLKQEVTVGEQALMEYPHLHIHLVKGKPRCEISELADRIQADLLVMGTVARTGMPGLIMGNTAESILNRLHASVLAIKPSGFVSPVTLED